MVGEADKFTYNGTFSDVGIGSEGANSVAWAIANGITTGSTSTTFAPNANVERQQVAVFFDRFLTSLDIELPAVNNLITFTDSNNISDYAKDSIKKLQQVGIMSGNADGSFNPKGNITRAQLAIMVDNVISIATEQYLISLLYEQYLMSSFYQ